MNIVLRLVTSAFLLLTWAYLGDAFSCRLLQSLSIEGFSKATLGFEHHQTWVVDVDDGPKHQESLYNSFLTLGRCVEARK